MTLKHFTELKVWRDSIALAKDIYSLSANFPKDELYGLVNQIRRAIASVGANIAEGFGRNTQKEKIHFYYIARGSLLEVEHFLYLAKELGYLSQDDLDSNMIKCENLLKSLQAYGKQLKIYDNRQQTN